MESASEKRLICWSRTRVCSRARQDEEFWQPVCPAWSTLCKGCLPDDWHVRYPMFADVMRVTSDASARPAMYFPIASVEFTKIPPVHSENCIRNPRLRMIVLRITRSLYPCCGAVSIHSQRTFRNDGVFRSRELRNQRFRQLLIVRRYRFRHRFAVGIRDGVQPDDFIRRNAAGLFRHFF